MRDFRPAGSGILRATGAGSRIDAEMHADSSYDDQSLSDNNCMPAHGLDTRTLSHGDCRLRKHADYQRVYHASRKFFSASMTYFYSARDPELEQSGAPRVGLTAGRVLGNAVERNRIKRRMREAVRKHISMLPSQVDVILHPRKLVLNVEFARLEREVEKIFSIVKTEVTTGKADQKSAVRP